jgi:F-box protein 11
VSSAPLTLEVSPLGQTPYRTISAALQKAKPGSKIRVRSGIYQESLVLDKAVEIEPAQFDPGGIVLEGVKGPALTSRAPAATVRGLTLRLRADANADFCVDVVKGRVVLDDCDLTGGTKAAVGVRGAGATPYFSRCRINKSPADGILVSDHASPTFDDCQVIGSTGSGLRVTSGARPISQGCLFQKNGLHGLRATGAGAATLTRCDFVENGKHGALLEEGSAPTLKACLARANGMDGVASLSGSAPVLVDCTLQGNTTGVAAYGGSKLTVRGCKFREQRNNGLFLQEKCTGSLEDCEVWGSGWHGIVFGGEASLNLTRCTSRDNVGSALQVHGGARPTLEDCQLANGRDWSCVLISGDSEPIFRRTRIRDSARGGIEVQGAKLTMEQCEVFGHAWSGLSFRGVSGGTLKKCTFRNNAHWGVAFFDEHQVTVEECETRANPWGGVGNQSQRQPTIRASRIQ